MSFSYSPSLTTPKDQARLRLNDRLNGPAPYPVFQDEEILAMLSMYSYDEACAQLAESGMVWATQQASTIDNGPVKYVFLGRAEFFKQLATSIRSLASPPPGAPAFTGASAGKIEVPGMRDYRTD